MHLWLAAVLHRRDAMCVERWLRSIGIQGIRACADLAEDTDTVENAGGMPRSRSSQVASVGPDIDNPTRKADKWKHLEALFNARVAKVRKPWPVPPADTRFARRRACGRACHRRPMGTVATHLTVSGTS